MRPRHAILLALTACVSQPPEPVITPPTRAPTEPGRHVREDGERRTWFDETRPILRTRDGHGEARTVLELPPLEHPNFPLGDPLAYLQRPEDLSLTAGVLCLDLHDGPEAPQATYNLRVDLVTGKHQRRLVEDLRGDQCGTLREAVRPRLCTPLTAGAPSAPAPAAPAPAAPATPARPD